MTLESILESDKRFDEYREEYPNTYYKAMMNRNREKKFLKQATVFEIALYYMGAKNRPAYEMPCILAQLSRLNGLEIPHEYGIMTPEYWDRWHMDNIAAVYDSSRNFM